MDRQHAANLWDQVIACDSPVVLLTGPASSGKTATALSAFAPDPAKPGCPDRMLIVPNRQTADHLREQLLAASDGGVIVSPTIITFDDLAQRILRAAPNAPATASLSPFRRRLILRNILGDLAGENQLRQLAPLCNTPGLLPAIEAAIAELKRAAVAPERLAQAVSNGALDHDLLAIYQRFQQALHEAELTDVEGRMWLARDALIAAATTRQPLPGLATIDYLIVDGFTEFTPTQLDILQAASTGAGRTIITLPHQEDGRWRLWHWTQRTIDLLNERFADRMSHVAIPPGDATGPSRLAELVFADLDTPASPPAGLSVIRASGKDAEIAAVARRIKPLLLNGVPAERIAVVARSLAEYEETIYRVFTDHDLPLPPPRQALTDTPIIRFLLAVADLSPTFSAEAICRILTNSYFLPEALGSFDPATASLARQILVSENVLAGREACFHAVERYRHRCELMACHPTAPAPATGPQVASAGALLAALFDLVGQDLRAIIEGLGLVDAACQATDPTIVARDLRTLAAVETALNRGDHDTHSHAVIADALSQIPAPPARAEQLIACLDALDARALRYDHVFLVGLNEGVFPARLSAGALISESRRRDWNAQGLTLAIRDDLIAREMLLFYMACTRAQQTLTLSLLQTDSAGGPVGTSPFLSGLLDSLDDVDSIPVETIPLGLRVEPDHSPVMSRHQALRSAMVTLLNADGPACATPIPWPPHQPEHSLRWMSRGTFANASRWQRSETAYDGILNAPAVVASLQEYCTNRAVFSASRLECYQRCPWQYFAQYQLDLAPSITIRRTLDPLARGSFIHHVLFEVMTALTAGAPEGLVLGQLTDDQLDRSLGEAFDQATHRLALECPPAYEAVRDVELAQLRDQLRQYLQSQRDAALGTPVYFEWGFGLPRDIGDGDMDPTSEAKVATFETPAGPIRLGGRVDRIDRISTPEGPAWAVVDYKTGTKPTKASIESGQQMQILLYSDIVSARLGACVGGAYHCIGRKCDATTYATIPVDTREKRKPVDAETFDNTMDTLRHLIAANIQQLAAGRFPLTTTANQCATWCPYRRICQFSAARAGVQADIALASQGERE